MDPMDVDAMENQHDSGERNRAIPSSSQVSASSPIASSQPAPQSSSRLDPSSGKSKRKGAVKAKEEAGDAIEDFRPKLPVQPRNDDTVPRGVLVHGYKNTSDKGPEWNGPTQIYNSKAVVAGYLGFRNTKQLEEFVLDEDCVFRYAKQVMKFRTISANKNDPDRGMDHKTIWRHFNMSSSLDRILDHLKSDHGPVNPDEAKDIIPNVAENTKMQAFYAITIMQIIHQNPAVFHDSFDEKQQYQKDHEDLYRVFVLLRLLCKQLWDKKNGKVKDTLKFHFETAIPPHYCTPTATVEQTADEAGDEEVQDYSYILDADKRIGQRAQALREFANLGKSLAQGDELNALESRNQRVEATLLQMANSGDQLVTINSAQRYKFMQTLAKAGTKQLRESTGGYCPEHLFKFLMDDAGAKAFRPVPDAAFGSLVKTLEQRARIQSAKDDAALVGRAPNTRPEQDPEDLSDPSDLVKAGKIDDTIPLPPLPQYEQACRELGLDPETPYLARHSEYSGTMPPEEEAVKLRPWQVEAIVWAMQKSAADAKAALLAHVMGLGKTVSGIMFLHFKILRDLERQESLPKEDRQYLPSLIIFPANLQSQWIAEFERLKPYTNFKLVILVASTSGVPRGSPMQPYLRDLPWLVGNTYGDCLYGELDPSKPSTSRTIIMASTTFWSQRTVLRIDTFNKIVDENRSTLDQIHDMNRNSDKWFSDVKAKDSTLSDEKANERFVTIRNELMQPFVRDIKDVLMKKLEKAENVRKDTRQPKPDTGSGNALLKSRPEIDNEVQPWDYLLSICESRIAYCVVDEAACLKTLTTLTFISVKNLKAKFVFLLTGTPTPNKDADWLSYLWLLYDRSNDSDPQQLDWYNAAYEGKTSTEDNAPRRQDELRGLDAVATEYLNSDLGDKRLNPRIFGLFLQDDMLETRHSICILNAFHQMFVLRRDYHQVMDLGSYGSITIGSDIPEMSTFQPRLSAYPYVQVLYMRRYRELRRHLIVGQGQSGNTFKSAGRFDMRILRIVQLTGFSPDYCNAFSTLAQMTIFDSGLEPGTPTTANDVDEDEDYGEGNAANPTDADDDTSLETARALNQADADRRKKAEAAPSSARMVNQASQTRDMGASYIFGPLCSDPLMPATVPETPGTRIEMLAAKIPKFWPLCAALFFHVQQRDEKVILLAEWPAVTLIVKLFVELLGIRTISLSSNMDEAERAAAIDRWNRKDDEARVFITTYRLAAHGLNLHKACHVLIGIEIPVSFQHWLQAKGRIHRLNQSEPQYAYLLLQLATHDEYRSAKNAEKLKSTMTIPGKAAFAEQIDREIRELDDVFKLKFGRDPDHKTLETFREVLFDRLIHRQINAIIGAPSSVYLKPWLDLDMPGLKLIDNAVVREAYRDRGDLTLMSNDDIMAEVRARQFSTVSSHRFVSTAKARTLESPQKQGPPSSKKNADDEQTDTTRGRKRKEPATPTTSAEPAPSKKTKKHYKSNSIVDSESGEDGGQDEQGTQGVTDEAHKEPVADQLGSLSLHTTPALGPTTPPQASPSNAVNEPDDQEMRDRVADQGVETAGDTNTGNIDEVQTAGNPVQAGEVDVSEEPPQAPQGQRRSRRLQDKK